MSLTTYRLTPESVDSLFSDLSDQLSPTMSSRASQYRSDLDILTIVISVVGSFLASVAANQFPPFAQFKAKARLTREDLHQFRDDLSSKADLDAAEERAVEAIESSLPDVFHDKKATSQQVFNTIKRDLLSQRNL